jgi:hypothetical protein
MEYIVDPVPVHTDIIRILASGPSPANTLVFLSCRASGADISISRTDLVRFEVEFKTKLHIDGFKQAQYEWYVDNTKVSATGMIRLANTTTDMEFLVALDNIQSFLDLDGGLGFKCQFGLRIDGLGLLERTAGIDMVCDVCAYLLVFEPVTQMLHSGRWGKQWRDGPWLSEVELGGGAKHIVRGSLTHGLRLKLFPEQEMDELIKSKRNPNDY